MVPKQGRTNWSMLSCYTIGTFQRLNAVFLPEAWEFEGSEQYLGCSAGATLSVCGSHLPVLQSPLLLKKLHDRLGGGVSYWQQATTQTGWHWWVILFMKDPCKRFQTTNLSPTTRKPLSDIIAANLSRQVSQHLSEAKHQLSVDCETRQTNQPEPRLDWLHHAALPEVNKTLTYWSTSHKHKHVITCFKRHKSNVLLHMKEICCL